MRVYFIITVLLLGIVTLSDAHDGKKHKKDTATSQHDSTEQAHDKHVQGDTVHHHDEGMKPDRSKVTADLDDFPSLHPLIVHFAIVLIVVAAVLQLLNIFLLKKELAWIITVILLIGFSAAWLASKNFHPHTHGLNEHAKLVLEQHDKFADWTINTAMVGLALQIIYLVMLKYATRMSAQGGNGPHSLLKRLSAVVVAVVLLSSSYFVCRAGHYGAQLVHIEGVGPQGKFLEMEHHH